MEMEDRERLLSVFRKCLNLEQGVDPVTIKYGETKGWKSLAHMSLVAAIEDEFNIMLDTADVLDMSSFDKAVQLVDKYQRSSAA